MWSANVYLWIVRCSTCFRNQGVEYCSRRVLDTIASLFPTISSVILVWPSLFQTALLFFLQGQCKVSCSLRSSGPSVSSDSVGLRWGPWFPISTKFPGGASAVDPGTTLKLFWWWCLLRCFGPSSPQTVCNLSVSCGDRALPGLIKHWGRSPLMGISDKVEKEDGEMVNS